MTDEHRRDAGRVVIVGGGLAGYSAAERLRQLGHAGSITIVEQQLAMYDRPPLSKELFSPDFGVEKLLFATTDTLQALDISVIYTDPVSSLDAETGAVTLASGTIVAADTVLLATGGLARQLPAASLTDESIIELRSIDDALRLRSRVAPGKRVVVVGAGLIGAEISSALLAVGTEVDLVSPGDTPLTPAVGELLAEYLHDMHQAQGVRVHPVSATTVTREGAELVVELANGETLSADIVVVGIGIEPNTGIAADAGLDVDNGVLVDTHQRTSAPRVFAAGDCARRRLDDGTLERRKEHWEGAQLSGQAAAAGMLGVVPAEQGSEWFWSDRYGVHLEAVGRLSGPGLVVPRQGGDHPAVFLVDDGVLVGAAAIDDSMTVRAARRFIDQRLAVSPRDLADPSVSLRTMLKAAKRQDDVPQFGTTA